MQLVGQQHPVGQAGQRVKVGDVLQLALVFFHGRDVGEHCDIVLQRARSVVHRADGEQLGKHLAVFAPVPDFTAPVPGRFNRLPPGRIKLRTLTPGTQQRPRFLAYCLFTAVTGDAGEGVIDIDDDTARIGDDDALAGVTEHGG